MAEAPSVRFELFAEDVAALRDFLERALAFSTLAAQPGYTEMRLGSVRIGLGDVTSLPQGHPLRFSSGERSGLGVEIVIETDDVDAAFRHASASGYAIATPLGRRPWGPRDFRMVAPGGYYFRITSR